MKRACAILIFDRRASRDGPVVVRACGFPTHGVVSVNGDMLFAACGRHTGRLKNLCGSAASSPGQDEGERPE